MDVGASEPCAAQRVFVASRAAALELYGDDGLRQIAERLPPDVRGALIDSAIITEAWLPERFVMAWQEAVFEGPARGSDDAFRRYVDKVVDAGFGRVRRLLVNLVTPATLCTRAAELWHDEHTHGEISATPEGHVVIIRLRHHPYVARPIARVVMAESLRYAASLTRAKHVVELHRVDGDALEVRLTWS
ncbi:MAG TPA: hypothetical protein VN947_10600 [Polyangia bacterium]|nr:hypothetical protein [Polyangia bacterium]